MKTVVVASRQQGGGKSMLACQIAAAADALEYSPSVLIDLARSTATRRWSDARRNRPPACVRSTADRLPDLVAKLIVGRIALAVIDTAPYQLVSTRAAVVLADLVLIPITATVVGLDAARHTTDMARRAGVPSLIVINDIAALPDRDFLLSLPGIAPLAPTVIRRHPLFPECMAMGGTVFEREPFGDVTRDIHELWNTMAFMLEADERARMTTAAE